MNILYTAYAGLGKGGAEVSMHTLAKQFPNVHIASTQPYPDIITHLLPQIPPLPIEKRNAELQEAFERIIQHHDIKLIHSHDSITAIPAIRAAHAQKIPVVTHYRDYWFVCPISSLLKPNLTSCTNCSYTSLMDCQPTRIMWNSYKHHYLKHLNEELDSATGKIAISNTIKTKLDAYGINHVDIIANPVDTELFKKPHERPALPQGFTALYVGSLNYHKGIHLLIELINSQDDIHFIIIGNGPMKDSIPNKSNVHMLGSLSHEDVIPYYQHCNVLLIPSLWEEPFGRTAIEGMAAGIPIIASNTGGLKEILQYTEAHLLNPQKPQSWNATINFLKNQPPIRTQPTHYPYDIATITHQIKNHYKKVIMHEQQSAPRTP